MSISPRFCFETGLLIVGGSAFAGVAGYAAGSTASFLIRRGLAALRPPHEQHEKMHDMAVGIASSAGCGSGVVAVVAAVAYRLVSIPRASE
jgi:hypothetical protein